MSEQNWTLPFFKQFIVPNHWAIDLLIALVIAFICTLFVNFVYNKLDNRFTYQKSNVKKSLVRAIRAPLNTLIWVLTATWAAQGIILPSEKTKVIDVAIHVRQVLTILCLSWFLLRWQKKMQSLILNNLGPDHPHERAKFHIFGRVITLVIIIVALTLALHVFGFHLQTLLTLGGVGGLALGIAGKDVIANFFGGFMLFMTRPFILGEWVRSPSQDIEGIVEEIGWYYTCIRGFNKQPYYVPNSNFSTAVVVTPSRMTHWKIEDRLMIRHKDLQRVKVVIEQIQQLLLKHPELDPSQDRVVFVDKLTATSLELSIACYTTAIKKHVMADIKQDILLSIAKIIQDLGMDFAYPVTSVELINHKT